VIVIDTGPVVAAANRKDDHHEQCVQLLQGFPGPLLLPAPLITEIGYMLYSRAGSRAEAGFLRDVADGVYELVQAPPMQAAPRTLSSSTQICLSVPPTPSSSLSRRDSAR
jgi:predicted nucleic acid-binding protein